MSIDANIIKSCKHLCKRYLNDIDYEASGFKKALYIFCGGKEFDKNIEIEDRDLVDKSLDCDDANDEDNGITSPFY